MNRHPWSRLPAPVVFYLHSIQSYRSVGFGRIRAAWAALCRTWWAFREEA